MSKLFSNKVKQKAGICSIYIGPQGQKMNQEVA